MIWEAERHQWAGLRAMGSAMVIPKAISILQDTTCTEDAESAYWKIDNIAIVQGALFEAALPTTSCLVSILPRCSPVGRIQVLELLVQLGAGEPHPSEIAAGNKNLHKYCVRELSRGVGQYVALLENGDDDERGWCVDLLGICAREDKSLRTRVKWYWERLLTEDISEGLRRLVQNWLTEFPEGAGE